MKHLFLFIALIASSACHAGNWMKDINDDTNLCRISIPGTHDAGTGNGFEGILAILGPATAQTQELDLAAQWDAGVRAFDLRPKLSFGQLKIFHGVIETRLTFDNALKTICQKLAENPSECAIVFMDFAGVDTFNYTEVNGKKLLSAVIDCNTKLPTTIADAIVNVTDNHAYGINGMRISKKTKGIVIVNGRKYIR